MRVGEVTDEGDSDDEALRGPRARWVGQPIQRNQIVYVIRGFPVPRRTSAPLVRMRRRR